MQTKKITKFSAASLTAIALMVGGAGVAGAQDADTANTDSTEESTKRDGNGRRHGKKAIVAEVLDITPEELAEQREGGATLADIAGDQVDEVVDALVANAEERIAAKVDAGRITQEQADARLEQLEERITERIETGERGDREGRRDGRRGNRGGNRGAQAGLTQS